MGVPFEVPGATLISRGYGSIDKAAETLHRTWFGVNTPVLFRVEAQSYAYCIDPESDHWGSTDPRLELRAYRITRVTPKGFWIEAPAGPRWVPSDPDRKRWACWRPQDALQEFIQRRRAQVRIVERQLARARAELALAAQPHLDPVLIAPAASRMMEP